ncbi:hypothetical protein A45J_0983 [hot springs metagenome]
MEGYLPHHLEISGSQENQRFSGVRDEAVLAIHQGSGGLLRKANLLAKGSLIRAAMKKNQPDNSRTCKNSINIAYMNNKRGYICPSLYLKGYMNNWSK